MNNILIYKKTMRYSRPKFYANATLLSPVVCCKQYIRGMFQKFLSLPCSCLGVCYAPFKALTLTFIMMLIFSCCTVSFNNYSTLYMAFLIPLACFHVIELCIIIFESESFKPGIIQTTKENCIVFLLFVTYNVNPNVRKATKCVDLI